MTESSNAIDCNNISNNKNDAFKIKVLVCTANIGNQKPDVDSLSAWIPKNGSTKAVFKNQPYLANVRQKFKVAMEKLMDDPMESKILGMRNNGEWSSADSGIYGENGDDSEANHDDESNEDKFDIIAIGMQEATFEVVTDAKQTKIGKNVKKLTSQVTDLTTSENYQTNETNLVGGIRKISSLAKHGAKKPTSSGNSSNNKVSKSSFLSSLSSIEDGIRSDDDTGLLHQMLQDHLPDYTRVVSFQRGQMRLIIFYNQDAITMDVLSVQAQNTGLGGLANKGGIVAECNVNSGTRISFLSAHLEAHEGLSKYKTRCSSLADILRGTRSSSVPDFQCDASLASHFMFVMGDLNFRTRLPDFEIGSQEHIEEAHNLVEKKDWKTLNDHDELANALRNKDCLVGFKTGMCDFPPTFKVLRMDGYKYNEKRSPSYTDRILYKGNHLMSEKIKLLAYEPIDQFTTSDHKPIRGAFEIQLNSPLRWRPVLVRGNRSIRFMGVRGRAIKGSGKVSTGDGHSENLHLFVSSIKCNITSEKYTGSDYSPSPFVLFVSTPSDAMKKDVSPRELLRNFFRLSKSNRISEISGTQVQLGWPRTKHLSRTCNPEWQEEVHFKVRTHNNAGTPMDLTGAFLYVLVVDAKDGSKLIGSCSLNLALLISFSRAQRLTSSTDDEGEEQESHRKSGMAMSIAARFLKMIGGSASQSGIPDESIENSLEALNKTKAPTNSLVVPEKIEEDKIPENFGIDRQDTNNSQQEQQHQDLKTSFSEENVMSAEYKKSGPSDALKTAYKASVFASSTRKLTKSALKTASSDRGCSSLDSLDIHCLKIDESLTKNGKEVGRIRLMIDTWWLDDKVAEVMAQGNKNISHGHNRHQRHHRRGNFRVE